MNHHISGLRLALVALFATCAFLIVASFAPISVQAQSTTPNVPQLDLSDIPLSQIGTPIALFIKCVLLQQAGPPIPGFETECAGVTTPPPGTHESGGGLTGQVVAPPSMSTGEGSLTGVVEVGDRLTGEVVPTTQVGGESSGGGGGSSGGGGSPGGGGGGGGSSPGEVLGTTSGPAAQPSAQGGYVPDLPAAGAGGNASYLLLILLSAAIISATGVGYLALSRRA